MKVLFMAWDIYDDTNTLPQFFQCCTGGSLVIKNICEYVGRKCESYLFIGKNKVPEMDLGNIHIIGTNMIPEIQDSSNETYLQTMATAFSDTLYFIAPLTTSPIINAPIKLIHSVKIGNVVSKGKLILPNK